MLPLAAPRTEHTEVGHGVSAAVFGQHLDPNQEELAIVASSKDAGVLIEEGAAVRVPNAFLIVLENL